MTCVWRVWRVLLFTFCCVWWFLWFWFVYFWFAATQRKSDTHSFVFSFFGTYTHECTWTFMWFVCNGITAHILVSYSPTVDVCRRACYCVCVFGFVGCLMTGLIIYLFSGFWVTLMYSANFRRVWVDGFPKQAIWYILFIDSALASREQSWEAFRLHEHLFLGNLIFPHAKSSPHTMMTIINDKWCDEDDGTLYTTPLKVSLWVLFNESLTQRLKFLLSGVLFWLMFEKHCGRIWNYMSSCRILPS